MFPPPCNETHLNESGFLRACCLDAGHDGDHMDTTGRTWEPPGVVLQRFTERWGRTHRIAWTGQYWVATDRNPHSRWRTQVEPTPQQLEMALRHHHGSPVEPTT